MMHGSPKVAAGMSRRSFMQGMGAAAALAMAGVCPASGAPAKEGEVKKAWVGTNIYGWGQYYKNQGKDINDHVGDVFSLVRDAGYDYIEVNLDTVQPAMNLVVAELMKSKGLLPVSFYTGARLHDEKAGSVVKRLLAIAKVCQEAGFFILTCNPDPIGRTKTDVELANQVAAINDLGQGLAAIGMKLGLHQHLPEMADNAREFHHLFRNSNPKKVGWCYDVNWIYRGGITPQAALKEYGSRVVCWHLRQSRKNVWYETLDTGDIDYAEVAKFARRNNLPKVYTVELALEPGVQVTRDVVANHKLSREFVRKTFGV